MKVLVCGASGLVGSNLMKVLKANAIDALGSYFSYPLDDLVQLDTLNLSHENTKEVMDFGPDVIVHCGALTHVDYCEDNVEESFEKTVQSTLNLLELANELNAKFVFISTDYVFDGADGPYLEEEEVNPVSVYGRHKLEAEKWVQEKSEDYLILRITNVYGDEARNKNFVSRILEKAEKNEDIELVLPVDQFATPTNAHDIAGALVELLKANKKGIYHLAGLEYMNRVDLALNVLKFVPQASYTIKAMETAELNQKAKRPLNGGLIRTKFSQEFPLFDWTSLGQYLRSKNLGK